MKQKPKTLKGDGSTLKDMLAEVDTKPLTEAITLRENSLEWFFAKTSTEKVDLKQKHFANAYIAFDSQWVFHFTFGQIEEMYVKEQTT